MKNRGLAFKLAALILACTALIFALIFAENYKTSREIILENVENNAKNLAEATVYRIETVLSSVQKVAGNLAYSLENADPTEKELIDLGRRVIENNPEIYGSTIAFEPFAFDPFRLYFAPYRYHLRGEDDFKYLGGQDYRYFYMDWYQIPKELDHPIWTEPYFDSSGGHALMSTYSAPFHKNIDGKPVFQGVVTADVSLAWLEEIISSVQIFDTGFAFLISTHGTYLTHPSRDLVMNQTIFSLAEDAEDENLREIGRKMIAGESDFIEMKCPTNGKECFLFYAPLPSSGWSLGVLFPKEEMFADIITLNHIMWITGGIGFLLLFAVIVFIARSITRPLRDLSGKALEIAAGDLDAPIPFIKSNDEVGDLAQSFSVMKSSLKDYIRNLTETTASKERIESELRIARDIQMGILPKLFPAFPERTEFDIYATIEPAREVGGDLYDFFFVDENTFCFLIGDVSGKGVPAAFFMAVAKTLLKVIAERGLDAGEVLAKVNDDLAEDNDSCMFATLFISLLDINTGRVRYASAGHNPPILLRENQEPEYLPPRNEPVAGAMEGMSYTTDQIDLTPGDAIFMFTDGVTEAMDHDLNIYSDERLMDHAQDLAGKSANEVVDIVDKTIKDFTGGAEQSDDITMLCLRYYGSNSDKS